MPLGHTKIKSRLPGLAHVLQHELPVYDFFLLFDRQSQVLRIREDDDLAAGLPRYMYFEYNLGPRMIMPLERWRGGRLPPLFYTQFNEDEVFEWEEDTPLEMQYDLNKSKLLREAYLAGVARPSGHKQDDGQVSQPDDSLNLSCAFDNAPVHSESPIAEQEQNVAMEVYAAPSEPIVLNQDPDYVYDAEFEPWRGQSIDWSKYQPSCDHRLESAYTSCDLHDVPSNPLTQNWVNTQMELEPLSKFCVNDTQGWAYDIPAINDIDECSGYMY